MNKKVGLFAIGLFIIGALQLSAQNKKDQTASLDKAIEKATIKTTSDSISYALGFSMGKQGLENYLKQMGIADDPEKLNLFLKGLRESLPANGENTPYITGLGVGDQTVPMVKNFSKQNFENESSDNLDLILVTKGIEDALLNKKEVIDNSELVINELVNKTSQRIEGNKEKERLAKIDEGKRFFEENGKKEGVVTLPSGLQYKILIKGNGEIPTETDKVNVLYKGSLIDGTVFDDGYKRGTPTVLGVNQVIKGWTEALQMMPVGSKWELYIPYELGYGERATGPIPAYSTLIFDLNLLGIEKEDNE